MATREERFWAKVDRRGPGDCWEWLASRDGAGYGQFWDPERRTMGLAHRYAYELLIGPLPAKAPGTLGPSGTCVLHSCDNPSCVNPAHLFLGDQAANMADRSAKGRNADLRGARNPRSRLTPAQVAEIRDAYTGAYGEIAAFARSFGVSHGAVSHALHGRSWLK